MSQRRSLPSQSNPVSSNSTNMAAVTDCVRYILYREGSKRPISRADIVKHLSPPGETQKKSSKDITSIIEEAKIILKKVYGYSLVRDSSQYMVVLNEPCENSLLSSLVDPIEYAMLNAALAHIFMSGGSVTEDDMWKFLENAGLMKQNDKDITKLFRNKFTSQAYLKYTRKDANNLLARFAWGPRASQETSKMFMLEKVAKALEKDPQYWCEQHKEATSETNSTPNGSS